MGCVLTGGRYRKTFNTNDLQICANSANSANSEKHTPIETFIIIILIIFIIIVFLVRVGIKIGVSAVSAVSAR